MRDLLKGLVDFYVVVNIPMWTDIAQAVAAIIAVPGAIAAFVILFKKDREKTELIRQLTFQTGELSAQTKLFERRIRLQFKPRVWITGGGFMGHERTVKFMLKNRAHNAFVKSIKFISGDEVKLNTWEDEIILTSESHIVVIGDIITHKQPGDMIFYVEVIYRDEENYEYRMVGEWKGGKTKIIEDEEL